MPMKLLSTDDFRAAAKAGERLEGTVFRFATTEPQAVDGKARTKRFVFSDATVDHSGDSIDPKGWDLAVFNSNPVALFSHMSWDPPIGKASNVAVQGDKLKGDIEFATAEVYDFADTIYRLVDGGFLKAVSVGFMPKTYAFSSDKDRPYGIDFKTQQLLEISVCPVPCNPNALSEARSLLHIDTRPLAEWAEKVLDTGDIAFLPRGDLEALRGQAKGAEPTRYYLSASKAMSHEAEERARHAVKQWLADPTEVIILPEFLELRTLGAAKAGSWECAAAKDLPLEKEGAWDGPAAEASIFEHAGGEDFDPAIAKKGFLAYDASKPKLRGSYKLPFAHVVDGKLTAVASGIRAAASRLPDTDIPDGVRSSAREVLDHYEAEMGDGDKSLDGLIAKIGDAALRGAIQAAVKAGRRISAATRARLEEAMGYHASMGECVMAVMNDDGATEPSDDEPDADDPTDQPPGQVSPPEDDLTPEQRRLREARAIKASLQPND